MHTRTLTKPRHDVALRVLGAAKDPASDLVIMRVHRNAAFEAELAREHSLRVMLGMLLAAASVVVVYDLVLLLPS